MASFRYNLNGGSWVSIIAATLPYVIAASPYDTVIVEPLGAPILSAGILPDYFVSEWGNDMNDGLTVATAKKTLAGISALGAALAGKVIGLIANSVFRETINLARVDTKLVNYDPIGGQRAAAIVGSTVVGGTWINVSGNVWSIAFATAPSRVIRRTDFTRGGYVSQAQNAAAPTSPAAGEWGHSSGALYINSTTDPNLVAYETSTIGVDTDTLVTLSSTGNVCDGISLLGSKRNAGICSGGSVGATFRNCTVLFACQDGLDGEGGANAPKNALIEFNYIDGCGYGIKGAVSPQGDNISFHANFSVVIRFNVLLNGWKSGIGNETSGQTTSYGNWLVNNWDNLAAYGVNMTNAIAPAFFHSMNDVCIHTVGQGNNRGFALPALASLNGAFEVKLINNLFYAGTKSNTKEGILIPQTSWVTMQVRGCIVFGYARGISDTSGAAAAALTLEKNCVANCTAPYYDNSTGTLAAKVDPGSISADPLFIDAANQNFRLQAGSPCINAGPVIAGRTTDKDGNPVPFGAAPDIGPYERQAA